MQLATTFVLEIGQKWPFSPLFVLVRAFVRASAKFLFPILFGALAPGFLMIKSEVAGLVA